MPRPTRRTFLAGASAALLSGCDDGPGTGPARQAVTTKANVFGSKVIAAPATAMLSSRQANPTQVWAYDGTVPGAGVRVTQGSRLRRRFVNTLPKLSTIHWHGVRIDNAMDGVPGLTQDPVPPGAEFLYDFAVPDAGTYWYHPHRDSLEQLSRGLSAPLIVKERQPPVVDADLALTINHWLLDANGQIAGYAASGSSPGPITGDLTVNGAPTLVWDTKRNERLRLRLINGTTDRTLTAGAQGLDGYVVALDGMPLAAPQRFANVVLAPAQRADLIVDVTAEVGQTATLRTRDGHTLATFPVGGSASQNPRPAPGPLPPNRESPLDLPGARPVDLVMRGGARGWTLNGVSGMTDKPLVEASLGETVTIRMVSDNAEPHAMHLHGHHFRQVTGSGLGPLRDTILMGPNARMSIAFVANNPGDWMFHCHMLAHMAAGMMTWLRVT